MSDEDILLNKQNFFLYNFKVTLETVQLVKTLKTFFPFFYASDNIRFEKEILFFLKGVSLLKYTLVYI